MSTTPQCCADSKVLPNPLGDRSRFLDIYVRGGARTEIPPKGLWTSSQKITKDAVDFNYCLDSTNERTVYSDGRVDPKDPPFRRLVTVRMENTVEGWKKRGFLNTNEVRQCPSTAP